MKNSLIKRLRRWVLPLLVLLVTVVGIVRLQAAGLAQMSDAQLTLAAAGLTQVEVAPGVYTLIASTDFPPSNPNAAICNATIVIGSDGVLIIDPFQTEPLANLAFATASSLTDQPIRAVLNTHYHFDHTGGNAAAAALTYPLIGRGPIRDYMLTRNLDMDDNATPPEVVLNDAGSIWLGDREVQFIKFDGHSGGTDLIAYIPDVDVMVAGDLLFTERFPFVADGNIRVWQETLDQLATEYATATIVPGHGPMSDREDLATLQQYLAQLETWGLAWKAAGLTQDEAIAQTEIPAEYSDYLFQGLFQNALETAYQQITLEQDDAASIQNFFQAQAPTLRAL